ncbi:hypothetical protein EXIGLDRAFT_844467 [Exidia glandulosa HHB12029]|uniref:Uncharacterized protein n=1 Tax=Exidia glandulosa HHB12029 TaxID=1314781 RepID=A0A165C142_EXIGL|nr:hypothetical protein EXIGLDRAFT_844467 [Exidia glandulosa HHB12029]
MKFSLVAFVVGAATAVLANPVLDRRADAILITGDVRMMIVQGFQGIIESAHTAIGHCQSGDQTPFPEAEAAEFIAVLTEFVRVHQMLLNVVIGKHGILAQFGYAEPVRVALVALEAVVDSFAFAFIGFIPNNVDEAMVQRGELDASINSTIVVYSS